MHRSGTLALAVALLLYAATPLAGQPGGRAPKDTLVVAVVAHPPSLDPHMQYEWVSVLVTINMFDSLVHRNVRLEYEPSLAVSWKALNDTVWEFKLREAVKFHNGAVMTAEDVKYSLDRVLDPQRGSPFRDHVRSIKTVRVMDSETIHIVTDRPFPLLVERLVLLPIVPKQHVERVGDDVFGESATVGTGPWKLAEFAPGQQIRLEAFDGHWRGKPPFRVLSFRVLPATATQVAELKTGGVDIVRNVPVALFPELRAHPQTSVSSAPSLRTHYVQLDMRAEPFNKKAVRQAANYAIDRDAIIRKHLAGFGGVVPTVVHPAVFGYDAAVTAYPYDPQKAKALLTQAGYADGVDITLHSALLEFRSVFATIAGMLNDVGFKTMARAWEPGPEWTKFFQGEGKASHGYYGSWGYYSVFDADAVLHPLYHRGPEAWVGKWYTRIDGLDHLIDQGRSTIDLERRRQTYAQIQRTIREESPSIFLFHEVNTLATSRKVEYAARTDQWLWLFDAKPRR